MHNEEVTIVDENDSYDQSEDTETFVATLDTEQQNSNSGDNNESEGLQNNSATQISEIQRPTKLQRERDRNEDMTDTLIDTNRKKKACYNGERRGSRSISKISYTSFAKANARKENVIGNKNLGTGV